MLRPGDLVRCRFALCPGTSPWENDVLTVMSVTPQDDPRFCLTCVSFASTSELLAYEFSDAQAHGAASLSTCPVSTPALHQPGT